MIDAAVDQPNQNAAARPRSKFLTLIAVPLLAYCGASLALGVFELKSTWQDCIDFSGSHGCVTKQQLSSTEIRTEQDRQYAESDEYFTLCSRKILHKNMPRLPENVTLNFGASNWNRNRSHVIVARHKRIYGQTGNHLRAFFKSFDMARDAGATLVIRDEGFPIDSPLNEVFLGLDGNNPQRNRLLEEIFGLFVIGPRDEMPSYVSKNASIEVVKSSSMFWYKSELSLQARKQHRQYLLQHLYQITADEMKKHPDSTRVVQMCSPLWALFGKGKKGPENNGKMVNGTRYMMNITEKFSVVHSRFFEGNGYKSLEKLHKKFGVDPKASIDLPPGYITSILTPLGMQNKSIVIIADGKNTEPVNRLKSDPGIGHLVHLVPPDVSSMIGDMMIGILGDIFIGNPASSKCIIMFPASFVPPSNMSMIYSIFLCKLFCAAFSWFIAQSRNALGLDHSYLFLKRHKGNSTNGSDDNSIRGRQWEIFCNDDCLYNEYPRTEQNASASDRLTMDLW